ncbi:MAG: hypothetical protein JO166_13180 [Deltaproteobacteria bacterium]|nr:hypothetical protein [Deltaproteobacteria bacterium]
MRGSKRGAIIVNRNFELRGASGEYPLLINGQAELDRREAISSSCWSASPVAFLFYGMRTSWIRPDSGLESSCRLMLIAHYHES